MARSDTFGGGAAQKSANATVAVTGSTGSVTATVAVKPGAFGYAWYLGRRRLGDPRRHHHHQ